MALERNVGGRDRLARGFLGLVLAVIAVTALLNDSRSLAVGATIGAVGLLFNAATQFCGVNAVLGIDTCSRE